MTRRMNFAALIRLMAGHRDMRLRTVLAGAALGAGLFAAANEAGAQTLTTQADWSISATGVGSCDLPGGCTAAHPPVYVQTNAQYGFSPNSSSSSSDPVRGSATASSNAGTGSLALPQLHSEVVGAPNTASGYSWNYSVVQGVSGYTWTGPNAELDVSDFVGSVDFTNSGGVGFANAALAIVDSSVEDPAIANLWYASDGVGGFAATCATPGAIAIGGTGENFSQGHITATVAPTCGSSTFHVNTGDEIFFWARLETFEATDGFVDATHTFTVSLNPDLSQSTIDELTTSFVPVAAFGGVAVPEPVTWALMLLGFGGVGAALRASRRKPAAATA